MKTKSKAIGLKLIVIVILLATVNILMLALLFVSKNNSQVASLKYPEASEIYKYKTLEEFKAFLTNIAKKKSGKYAYEFLLNNKFPPGTDLHLLGHAVGEQIYIQEGVNGMKECTPELQNACSHAIIVGFFSEFGENQIQKVKDACGKAPGGPTAYAQCFHGLGHGVLTYTGFDLKRTITICNKFGNARGESRNCTGGAIMEIVDGGFHDHALWLKARPKYISKTDPLSPCDTGVVPADKKDICYIFLTPNIYGFARNVVGASENTDEVYRQAFKYCDAIGEENSRDRDACFGAFGKEFSMFAIERKIGRDTSLNDEELGKVNHWCSLAEYKNEIVNCIYYALNSYYWGGENHYDVARRVCDLNEGEIKDGCYEGLISMIYNNNSDRSYIDKFCKSIPNEYKNKCLSWTMVKSSETISFD